MAATVDDASEGTVRHSAYHHMDRVVDEDDEANPDADRAVILLV